MKADLSAALESLQAQLTIKMAEVVELKKIINSVAAMMGEEAPYKDVEAGPIGATATIRPDLYYSKPFAVAAEMYLERRKQACSADEIVRGLEQGGFEFSWDKETRVKNTAISLGKNSAKFHRLPNGYYGMTYWYNENGNRRKPEE